MNYSDPGQIELALRRIWATVHRGDEGLGLRERELLHLVPPRVGVPLGWLAERLEMPTSSCSVAVKRLERRGLLRRARSVEDERRLAIVLTAKGTKAVESATLLDLDRLGSALAGLPSRERTALGHGLHELAAECERIRRR